VSGERADAPVQALLHPFLIGRLNWPTGASVLFMNARAGAALWPQEWPGLVCVQEHKPEVDALLNAGFAMLAADSAERYRLVLLLPPRQREHARACYVRALDRLAADGILVVAQANREGAKSCEDDLRRLCGPLQVLSKHQCRVFWTGPESRLDPVLADAWRELDAPRPIADGRFLSRPGVFAWDRIDPASQLLVDHLPPELSGPVADLGAGWGFLASELLRRCPQVETLDLYEADARALDLARRNLAAEASRISLGLHWHDVTSGLPRHYQNIVCNPPFHAQQARERIDLGQAFLSVAAKALLPGGRLWLVANRHLPYEALLADQFDEVRTLAQTGAYKVIVARRAGGARLDDRSLLRDQAATQRVDWTPRKRQEEGGRADRARTASKRRR
jgi:16S rRNA (guanine1207-N2)-methyltransferase